MGSTVLFRNIERLFFRFGSWFCLVLDARWLRSPVMFLTLIAMLLLVLPVDSPTLPSIIGIAN